MPFDIGNIIRDRYKINKRLGSGNWGVTYLVTDLQAKNSNFECVIKEIKPSPRLTIEQNKYYFQREVAALQVLGKHSQIPSFIDSFFLEEYFYIVQEFVAGTVLKEKIKPGKRITEKKAKKLLISILEIVHFIHHNKHVHRDLKPDNIIQLHDGKIVIIDFGTVKEINKLDRIDSGDTLSQVIGAPPYVAPERYSFPRPKEFDKHPRIDIYSIGIIGLQMVTGLSPNSLYIDPHNDGARLWSDAIFVSPQMKRILNKMAHPNYKPGYRYQTAAEVIKDLEHLKSPIEISPVSPSFSKIKILGISLVSLIAGALLMRTLPELLFVPKTEDYHINFAKVCNSPIIKGEKFKEYKGTPEHITFKKSPPFIWTVFRWKCVLTYKDDTQIVGINLNDYCAATYGNLGYKYEAYFKTYLNPNSWYCTNVGTKLKSKSLNSVEDFEDRPIAK